MRTVIRILAFVLVGVLPVLMHPVSARAVEEILDQAQTGTDGTWALIEDSYWPSKLGQIFTAGRYGYLTRISVYLENDPANPATAPIMVSIQTMAGGLPSGQGVASGIIYPENIPSSEGWVDVDIGAMVVATGTQYAIILSMAPDSTGRVKWFGDFLQDLYAGGRTISNYEDGQGWRLGNGDFVFETYVVPDTLDQVQTEISSYQVVTDARPVGQIFTPVLHGALNRVRVNLENDTQSPASGPITVSIQTTTDQGLPSGSEVGQGKIPVDNIPAYGSGGQWVDVSITPVARSPLILQVGAKYALLLFTGGGAVHWYTSTGDVYDQGTLLTRWGIDWRTEVDDGAFETYILEPVLDQAVGNSDYSGVTLPVYGGRDPSTAQVFTAGFTGFLDHVSIRLVNSQYEPTSGDIKVSILGVGFDEVPMAFFESATGTIPYNEIPPFGTFKYVDVNTSSLLVQKGRQYAINVSPSNGKISWYAIYDTYSGGKPWDYYAGSWHQIWPSLDVHGQFKTYIQPFNPIVQGGWGRIQPCANDVCPEVSGGFTPADFTAGVKGHFNFQVRTDGKVKGVLNFTDQRQESLVLHGCTTDSAACQLTVTTLDCTDQHAMKVEGAYTPKGGDKTYYKLNLSGVKKEIGTFTLTVGDYTYTLTRKGIVDVTCPPIDESP